MRNQTPLNATIVALCIVISVAALADGKDFTPLQDQLRAMSRIDHWTGLWAGSGWAATGPGQRETFDITERVTQKLGGSVLLVEGRGTSTGSDGQKIVTHEALGVVYYDAAARRYNFQTHDRRGRANEVELEVDDDGTMRWGFVDPRSGSLLRFEIRIEGDTWHETGRVSPDGGENWYPMLDMTLKRQPTDEIE